MKELGTSNKLGENNVQHKNKLLLKQISEHLKINGTHAFELKLHRCRVFSVSLNPDCNLSLPFFCRCCCFLVMFKVNHSFDIDLHALPCVSVFICCWVMLNGHLLSRLGLFMPRLFCFFLLTQLRLGKSEKKKKAVP